MELTQPMPPCPIVQAQKKGYTDHVLGPKEAERAPREFSEEQLKEGQKHVSLQMGSNKVRPQLLCVHTRGSLIIAFHHIQGANVSGQTPYGLPRQVQNVNLAGVK